MAPTVGERLRETRSERGLTLDQASQATHIRKSYLEALEKDQRDPLPSVVQGRGFLRLYAGYLNLPPERLLEAWNDNKEVIDPPLPPLVNVDKIAPTTHLTAPLDGETHALHNSPSEPDGSKTNGLAAGDQVEVPSEETNLSTVPVPVEFSQAGELKSTESGSQAIFHEIGKKLKAQRDALGLSVQEVERYTRLRQHYIQSLEEGRIDQLPSPVQGRGMLSNYSAFLNLDEEALLLRFAEGLQIRRIERISKQEPKPVIIKKRPARRASILQRFVTPDLIFGVIVVSGILFFAIRTLAGINAARSNEARPTTQAISEILLTPVNQDTGNLTNTPAAQTAPASTSTLLPSNLGGIDNPTQVATLPTPNGTPSPTSTLPFLSSTLVEVNTIEPTLEPINGDPLQVYIVAHERAYLRIIVDNQVKFNGRVVPGNAYAYSGLKNIELLTGNAAAIQVFFNQNDLGTLGVTGQVINLVFNLKGMVTATPLPTPTPSITPIVSVTPTTLPQTPGTTTTLNPTLTPTQTVKPENP